MVSRLWGCRFSELRPSGKSARCRVGYSPISSSFSLADYLKAALDLQLSTSRTRDGLIVASVPNCGGFLLRVGESYEEARTRRFSDAIRFGNVMISPPDGLGDTEYFQVVEIKTEVVCDSTDRLGYFATVVRKLRALGFSGPMSWGRDHVHIDFHTSNSTWSIPIPARRQQGHQRRRDYLGATDSDSPIQSCSHTFSRGGLVELALVTG